jgi:hypothetical protein
MIIIDLYSEFGEYPSSDKDIYNLYLECTSKGVLVEKCKDSASIKQKMEWYADALDKLKRKTLKGIKNEFA